MRTDTMAYRQNIFKILCIASTIALSSCGGGGDVAAGLTGFSVVPDEVKWAGAKGDTLCQRTAGGETVVTIVGGTPPYRVVSSFPDGAIVSKTEVTGKNPTFTVTTGPGCMESVTVLVLDYHSRSVTFSQTVEAGDELDLLTTTDTSSQ
ncbi:hypothetical protein [Hydrogenophaga crassostreae]|uniref:hypothetical protein n=1 Tax=Hydrogenophaga crassostreae TaxID=1763535 RepID=UPI0012FBFA30|nr:hypothetical protein [Hydrogenophaga crassostreae]